jgi:hypothetical protein
MMTRKNAFGFVLSWTVWAACTSGIQARALVDPSSSFSAATAVVINEGTTIGSELSSDSSTVANLRRLLQRDRRRRESRSGGNATSRQVDDDGSTGGDEEDEDTEDSTQFPHFIAHNKTMTCSADEHARPFNNQIRGVNLGGWMVLEPWITPSLFYQFLGKGEGTTAIDMYTFCEVLGPEEANRQLQRHWDAWVTEDIIRALKESGAVNSLRLPVGDFMFVPYGPYADGCIDGALERVDQLLDWAYSYGLTVLIDIHTMRDSQNGFDNSGQAMGFAWTSACTYLFVCRLVDVQSRCLPGTPEPRVSCVVQVCSPLFLCLLSVVRVRGPNELSALAHSNGAVDRRLGSRYGIIQVNQLHQHRARSQRDQVPYSAVSFEKSSKGD